MVFDPLSTYMLYWLFRLTHTDTLRTVELYVYYLRDKVLGEEEQITCLRYSPNAHVGNKFLYCV